MGSCCSAEDEPKSVHHSGEGSSRNNFGRPNGRVSSVAVASNPQTKGCILQSPNSKNFYFSQLKEATGSFHDDNLLGQGNFGRVFKGWIDEQSLQAAQPETGMAIAVKVLDLQGSQGLQELVAEISLLGWLRHPNLVKLIGYCLEDDQRLLVYEFMPKGSLERHIFRNNSSFTPLPWNLRMKIALGIAEGLAFLHEASVIYRDFKSSDVLLDLDYNAKLSDFGLAKYAPTEGSRTHISTRDVGTEEYKAPEYLGLGHLTAKSDVYSFGVVFLEMISGKQALDKARPQEEQRLVEWAMPYLSSKRNCLQVLDDNIRDEVKDKRDAVKKALKLAANCLLTDPRSRPNMKVVVEVLEKLYVPDENMMH